MDFSSVTSPLPNGKRNRASNLLALFFLMFFARQKCFHEEVVITFLSRNHENWSSVSVYITGLQNHSTKAELNTAIFGCYPLHPVSTFILPRLSERVAQNERTLFTFLSSEGTATLPSFLEKNDGKEFSLITPDLIYDYFEPLFKKEAYDGSPQGQPRRMAELSGLGPDRESGTRSGGGGCFRSDRGCPLGRGSRDGWGGRG